MQKISSDCWTSNPCSIQHRRTRSNFFLSCWRKHAYLFEFYLFIKFWPLSIPLLLFLNSKCNNVKHISWADLKGLDVQIKGRGCWPPSPGKFKLIIKVIEGLVIFITLSVRNVWPKLLPLYYYFKCIFLNRQKTA